MQGNLDELKALKAKSVPEEGGSNEGGRGAEDGGAMGQGWRGASAGAGKGSAESPDGRVSVEGAVDMLQKMMIFKRMQQQQQLMAQQGAGAGAPVTPPSGATTTLDKQARVCTLPPSHVDAGCTAVVACIRGSQLVVANACAGRDSTLRVA